MPDAKPMPMLTADAQKLINAQDKYGNRALHIAAVGGHIKVAEFLITQGAKINITNSAGLIPLHSAANHGHTALADFLITQGAELHAQTIRFHTPLHFVAQQGHKKTAEVLLAHGATVNLQATGGITVLDPLWTTNDKIRKILQKKANEQHKAITSKAPWGW